MPRPHQRHGAQMLVLAWMTELLAAATLMAIVFKALAG